MFTKWYEIYTKTINGGNYTVNWAFSRTAANLKVTELNHYTHLKHYIKLHK